MELEDSSGLLDAEDFDELRAKVAEDGYLFLRGFHPRALADAAYEFVQDKIRDLGWLAPETDWREGIASEENRNFAFFSETAVAHAPPVLALVNRAHTFLFYEKSLGRPPG